jgi:preprotein translocase subunit SecE
MAMNRAQKRMLQRQGALGADGQPTRERPQQARKAPPPTQQREQAREKRTRPVQFLREVRAELRKVAWPTRAEVINYSIIVLIAIVVLTTFIAIVDYGASEFVLKLFDD